MASILNILLILKFVWTISSKRKQKNLVKSEKNQWRKDNQKTKLKMMLQKRPNREKILNQIHLNIKNPRKKNFKLLFLRRIEKKTTMKNFTKNTELKYK